MADPIRPGEIGHAVGLVELAEQAGRHAAALFAHRHGLAHLSDPQRAGHVLAELAYGAALAQRALFGRWVVVVEALDAGVGHERVATATGLSVAQLHTGLRGWAAGQLRFGHITPDRHAEVLALLYEQAGGAPNPGARGADR